MKTPTITLYGIANCDTVRKARAWLDSHQVPHQFHDFKKRGVPSAQLDQWLQALGQNTLINRRGTTWRQLDSAAQADITSDEKAHALLTTHSSIIKRPVVDWGPEHATRFTAGFDAQAWELRIKAAESDR